MLSSINLRKKCRCLVLIGLGLLGCHAPGGLAIKKQATYTIPLSIFALPGALDTYPVLNSNHPELMEEPGILVSTFPGHLDDVFDQAFGVFVHHIATTPVFSSQQFHLGLLALNPGDKEAHLVLEQGLQFLTRPDAPFKHLPPLSSEKIYAGPGDRLVSEWLQQKSNLNPRQFQISPGEVALLYSTPIPTNPLFIFPQTNALSALMHFKTSAPLHLAYIALRQDGPVTLADYIQSLETGQRAGPRLGMPTPIDSNDTPPDSGDFRYGRVAGVQQGRSWQGAMSTLPPPGQTWGYPLSSVYLKRLGTDQNQSAKLLRRYTDAAFQAHGNYGVVYQLHINYMNTSAQAQGLKIGVGDPQAVSDTAAVFLKPPLDSVRFRGSFWFQDPKGVEQRHVVLKTGAFIPELMQYTMASGERFELTIRWVYPPDSTPPQLLTLSLD